MFSKSLRDFFKNPIIAIPKILFTLGIFLAMLPFNSSLLKLSASIQYSEMAGPEYILGQVGKLLLIMLIFFLVILIISPIVTSWSLLMTKNSVNLQKPDFIGSFKESFKYYWKVLGCFVLIGLMFFAAYIVFVILLTIFVIPISMAGAAYNSSTIAPQFIIIALILSLPLSFLAICVLPIVPLLIYDNLSLTEALGAGFKLGFKRFFRILGACLFVGIIIAPLSYILRNASQPISIILSVINTFLSCFIYVYIMNLYQEYKTYNSPSYTYQQPQGTQYPYNNETSNQKEDEQLSFYDENKTSKEDTNNKFRI